MTSTARLLFAAIATLTMAPVAASAQTNAFGYQQSAATYEYVAPPSGTAQSIGDDTIVSYSLPWAFPWFAGSYSSVYVSDNGAVTFTNAFATIAYANSCLPVAFDTVDIAIFWDDLEPDTGSSGGGDVNIWWDQANGNDRVIISWEDIYNFGGFAGGTFQLHLEPNGDVAMHWTDTSFAAVGTDNGASATIGIQDYSGSLGGAPLDEIQVSCNTALTLESTALSFSACSDVDGDGYNDAACGGDDCNDADGLINPGVLEICDNTIDEDCSGADLTSDIDGDTYTAAGCVGGDDCDDTDAAINPGVDADGDGSNACDDCNDTPGIGAFIFPGNPEICGNGVDEDCSGADALADVDLDTYTNIACGGDDCDDTDASINVGVDADGDGSNACDDCDDTQATALPGGTEVCDGGIDNDCDGNADDVDLDGDGDLAIPCGGTDCDDNDATVGANTDADGDGSNACDDCDDSDADVFPGQVELCDTTDSDCDGLDDAFDLDIGGQTGVSQVEGPGGGGFLQAFGAPVVVTLPVTAPGFSIEDLNVDIDITYDPTSDLQISLTSPSGTVVVLADQVGDFFGSANFGGTVFDDEATTLIDNGTAPFSGSYIPDGSLSAFDLEPADGNWTLTVTVVGFFGFAGGNLNSWTLDFTLQQVDDIDGDGAVDSCGDCDDTSAAIYPGAPETCGDGIDQDCDGVDATGDLDGDGYVDAACGGDDCDDGDAALNPGVDVDADGSNACDDCDDADADNYPGNLEVCADGIDQNCDGADNTGDVDADGYISDTCIGGDDCDDGNASVFPGAFDQDGDGFEVCSDCYDIGGDTEALVNPDQPETCDGLDNDCDGTFDNVDEDGDGFEATDCGGDDCDDTDAAINPQADGDGDGFHACQDCDDASADVYPGNAEVCDDGIDQSCTGADRVGDEDGDTYLSTACGGDDCDDALAGVNPGATDICDGVDLNCDGATVSTDDDGDGFYDADCGGLDCDDSLQSIHPDATEVCDGVDNNCDGAVLDGGEDDLDGDGVPSCGDDCDDSDDTIFPGAQELCDGVDNDCDGAIDNGVIRDGDQDGHDREACGGDDCDDGQAQSFPDNTEDCTDSIDNDCDGDVDGNDTDCDFSTGCSCDAGGDDPMPAGALALLLGALGLRARRRTWSAS